MNQRRLDIIQIIITTVTLFLYIMIPTFDWLTKLNITYYAEIIAVSIGILFLIFTVIVDIKKDTLEPSLVENIILPVFMAFLGLAATFLQVSKGVGNRDYLILLWIPFLVIIVYLISLSIKKSEIKTLILKYGCSMLIILLNIINIIHLFMISD